MIIESLSWRWSYIIYSIVILVLGLSTGLTFKPITSVNKSGSQTDFIVRKEDKLITKQEYQKSYDAVIQITDVMSAECSEKIPKDEAKIAVMMKLILGVKWCSASFLKLFSLYVPDLVLVSNYRYGLNSYKY